MKRTFKIFATILVLIAVPVLAGLGIMALWNGIVTTICGFSAITFLQGVGLFLLGQLLSCGFIIPLFLGSEVFMQSVIIAETGGITGTI